MFPLLRLQFYTKILNAFVESWFSLLSKNEDFVIALKHILREATCRLILKIKDVSKAKSEHSFGKFQHFFFIKF